ncbi:conserved protein of unknown function [uncultured Woeseiaceae bacterium]|uniref:Polymerase beta nucleotidyltransferase domain-containing protein n=1 Tax=uncultured Woeseiaceae bacterium TaxID=1983305 RepID=A0A7D9D582_9GAMM|nr:conserved protein of unknown function [uncultured Woeseiaceae bacterium]
MGISMAAGIMSASIPKTGSKINQRRSGRSLADALFTATQQRVFTFLFGQPGRSFYLTELIDLADAGRGAVQREVARLAASGLVSVERIGNQKHLRANPNSPLFEELCSIVRKTIGLNEPLRKALEPLAEEIALAMIYGSVAKGEDTATSDIDLLLVSDALSLEDIFAALASAEEAIARSINPTLYTTKEFNSARKNGNAFLQRVLDGPKMVLTGELDET